MFVDCRDGFQSPRSRHSARAPSRQLIEDVIEVTKALAAIFLLLIYTLPEFTASISRKPLGWGADSKLSNRRQQYTSFSPCSNYSMAFCTHLDQMMTKRTE